MRYSVRHQLVLVEVDGMAPGKLHDLCEYLRLNPTGGKRLPNGDDGHFVGLFPELAGKGIEKWLLENGATKKEEAGS